MHRVGGAFIGLLLGAALTVTGCTDDSGAPDPPDTGHTIASSQFVGVWVPDPPTDRHERMEAQADGILLSYDGCNSFSGTWAAGPANDAATIRIGGGTEIWCDYSHWVAEVASVTLDGDRLQAFDEAGDELGWLVRAED